MRISDWSSDGCSSDLHRTLTRRSPRLGRSWSSNGDFLTPAVYTSRRVSPTRGPTITAAIDFLDGSQDGNRFFVEDGGFPDVLGNSIGEVTANAAQAGGPFAALFAAAGALAGGRDPPDCLMPWFGQAGDAADGRVSLGPPWGKPRGRQPPPP